MGQYWFGAGEYFAPNPPLGAQIAYYLPARVSDVQVAIADSSGRTIRMLRGPRPGRDQSVVLGPSKIWRDEQRTGAGDVRGECRAGRTAGDAGQLHGDGDDRRRRHAFGRGAGAARSRLPDLGR
ncbi:MAG: hypothetical protein WDO73_29030 [Ignavibacteriota bacterium]